MIPEQAQVARGCGILALEPGGHVGNDWAAQEGTRSGLDLKPARESAGPHINQTIWVHGGDQVGSAPWGAASIWTGSGARCQVGHGCFVNICAFPLLVFA